MCLYPIANETENIKINNLLGVDFTNYSLCMKFVLYLMLRLHGSSCAKSHREIAIPMEAFPKKLRTIFFET